MAGNGLYGFDYGGRSVPLLLPEEFAQQQGLNPFNPIAPPAIPPVADARLAFTGDTPTDGAGTQGNVPDVAPNMGGGGAPGFVPSSGGVGGVAGANMAGTMGAAGSERQEKVAAESSEKKSADKGEAKGREPLKTTEIDIPDEYAGQAPQRSPGRVVKIPGGDVRTSFTRKPGTVLPEGYEEEQADIDRQSDLAYLGGVNAQLEAGQVQRAMYQEREMELQRRDVEIEKERIRRVKIDQEIQRRQSVIDRREAEAEQMGKQPATVAAFWEERGPMAQLMGMIGVALGAGAQGLGAPENPALRMQEKMIDTWVQDRREQYERGRDRVDDAKGAYADALKQWGTPEAAEQDLRMRAHAAADSWFELMAGRAAQQSGDAKMMTAVQAEMANRRQIRLDRKLEMQKLQAGEVIEQWQNRPDQYLQFGGAAKPKDIDRMVRLPNGEYAWARTESQAKEAQGKIAANAAVTDATARIVQLRNTPESRLPLTERRAQIQTAASDLFIALKEGANLGALDKGALEFKEKWTGNPEELLTPGSDARLREIGRGATKKIQDTARYYLHADPDAVNPITGGRPQSARSDE